MRRERGQEMGYFGRKKVESSRQGGGGRGTFQTERILTRTSGFLCSRELVCLLFKALPVPAPGPVGTGGAFTGFLV